LGSARFSRLQDHVQRHFDPKVTSVSILLGGFVHAGQEAPEHHNLTLRDRQSSYWIFSKGKELFSKLDIFPTSTN
jgi:hypothetical protein